MVVASPDEYIINVERDKVKKEFQFDHVYMPESKQEEVPIAVDLLTCQVYEDVHNLIQSAVDGYNVCIFAYGQVSATCHPLSVFACATHILDGLW